MSANPERTERALKVQADHIEAEDDRMFSLGDTVSSLIRVPDRVDPRMSRVLDPKAAPPPGRTLLNFWLVFFFRTDRMFRMPSFYDGPVVEDAVDLKSLDVALEAR